MFEKIVVAVDGSELGNKALEAAIAIGKQQQAMLQVLHIIKQVVVAPYVVGEMAYVSREYDEEIMAAMKKEGQELVDNAKAKAEAEGLTVSTHVITGDPARQILDFSKENHAKLIVMGSRGLGPFKEMMLGSVSHRVSQLSECPVLIVK
ncbi:universal stress protein [Aneurinibacillus terranovensis]|uniref:universal stress protein n=1 Tax=Aneurinibacillus terranovensis TaxID=278991 RepID=UPI000425B55A|nr:universal stress protein [Aneurinibacillus terranovensis]